MLRLTRKRDIKLLETNMPWAFRPGDLFSKDYSQFEITRVARRSWMWFRRQQQPRFVIYGTPADNGPR